MKDLAYARRGQCFVLVQTKNTASDEEWQKWIEFSTQLGADSAHLMRVLVFSAGGSPTPKQRKAIHALVPPDGRGVMTAVVLDSVIGRAVVSTMALFNPNVRAFTPDRVEAAFDYLQIVDSMRPELFELARQAHVELKLPFLARR